MERVTEDYTPIVTPAVDVTDQTKITDKDLL